jgi:DNA-directed RNA polymerase specialized sigma24 family protein
MFGSWFAVLGALMADAAPNPVPAETDRADLDRALQGDGDAFARIVARHQQRVAAHIWPLLRGAGVVEEVVHDTFVEAYLSLASFRGGAALSTWLCGIATRVCYRRMRDRDRRGRRDAAFAREQQRAIAESSDKAVGTGRHNAREGPARARAGLRARAQHRRDRHPERDQRAGREAAAAPRPQQTSRVDGEGAHVMSNPRNEFELPSAGSAPVVDVRASVLAELRARRSPAARRAEAAVWVGLIAAAAVLAFLAYDAVSDPFGPVMASVSGEGV